MNDKHINADWLRQRLRAMLRPSPRLRAILPTHEVSAFWSGYERAVKDIELAVDRRCRYQYAAEASGDRVEEQMDGGGA